VVALISKEVVTFGTIPASRTDQTMVSMDINHPVAGGAEELSMQKLELAATFAA
jgi:hypothetical protein